VGSTKRSIVRWADSILDKKVNFVASHPIAGSDRRGVEFARADLFKNHLCIVTPTSTTRATALKAIGSFWKMLGMRVAQLSADEHDRLLADVSHLPHLLAAALVAMQDEPALRLCGQGFLDATRIAGGDGGLWRDILLDNADNLRGGMTRFQAEVSRVMNMLESGEPDALRNWLSAAAQRRQILVDQKLREMRAD
jgi:prephenate dehydrogenase